MKININYLINYSSSCSIHACSHLCSTILALRAHHLHHHHLHDLGWHVLHVVLERHLHLGVVVELMLCDDPVEVLLLDAVLEEEPVAHHGLLDDHLHSVVHLTQAHVLRLRLLLHLHHRLHLQLLCILEQLNRLFSCVLLRCY